MNDGEKIAESIRELEKLRGLRPWACLIVDDDDGVSHTLGFLLERSFNCAVTYVSCCALALQALITSDFDYIFMDVIMPQTNGVECFRLVKQKQPNAKVVFITGFDDDFEGLRECLDKGAVTIIHKPVEMDHLKQLFP